MTSRDILARALVLLAPLGGCGDSSDREDGGVAVADNCAWPIESTTLGGSIELGIDRSGFAPLPDVLKFRPGGQAVPGVLLNLQARMIGLEPGDPEDLMNPGNPRTRFSATFADGTFFGRECPSRWGYLPSGPDGAVERGDEYPLEFKPMERAVPGFNTVVKLKVEVIDAEGRYASDERDVFCAAPDGWSIDAGIADAGPADAGPEADGGAADAGPESDASL